MALNSKHRTNRKKIKHSKRPKSCFHKEWVEKANRNKPALNKIMITHDKRINYNFVASLKVH